MADTADKALDLADKWAQQIGQKISDAAPGAQDIAMDAVKVKIASATLSWLGIVIILAVVCFIFKWSFGRFNEISHDDVRYRRDEEIPYIIIMFVCGFLIAGMTVAAMINFPSREIAGIVAPRGYVALMVLDKVSK